MKSEFIISPDQCISTHGAMGYASGSYWDGEDVVCGLCGFRTKSPTPTGSRVIFKKKRGILGWLGFEEESHREPTWPAHLLGKKGRKLEP